MHGWVGGAQCARSRSPAPRRASGFGDGDRGGLVYGYMIVNVRGGEGEERRLDLGFESFNTRASTQIKPRSHGQKRWGLARACQLFLYKHCRYRHSGTGKDTDTSHSPDDVVATQRLAYESRLIFTTTAPGTNTCLTSYFWCSLNEQSCLASGPRSRNESEKSARK